MQELVLKIESKILSSNIDSFVESARRAQEHKN